MSDKRTTYVVVNAADEYVGEEHDTLQEAKAAAAQVDGETAIVEFLYTFEDSELVWTSTGADTWPPNAPEEEREVVAQPYEDGA